MSLRFSGFPAGGGSDGEVVALSAFWKEFTDPIERVVEATAQFRNSYENAKGALENAASIAAIEAAYAGDALAVDRTDGLSLEFADWRFNIRMSNTEPVVRLNVESRGDAALMKEKTAEVLSILEG